MGNVYYIGGSSCSGKSTLATRLADRYGMAYYRFDDHLDEFMDLGARRGDEFLKEAYKLQGDALWLREPTVLADEELEIYRRIYKFCARDIGRLSAVGDVITEGAGYLPSLMAADSIAPDRYLCLVSSKNFERQRYEGQNFVNYALCLCSDRDKAFENWLDRDETIGIKVRKKAEETGYKTVNIDGSVNEDRLQSIAEEVFGLKKSE